MSYILENKSNNLRICAGELINVHNTVTDANEISDYLYTGIGASDLIDALDSMDKYSVVGYYDAVINKRLINWLSKQDPEAEIILKQWN